MHYLKNDKSLQVERTFASIPIAWAWSAILRGCPCPVVVSIWLVRLLSMWPQSAVFCASSLNVVVRERAIDHVLKPCFKVLYKKDRCFMKYFFSTGFTRHFSTPPFFIYEILEYFFICIISARAPYKTCVKDVKPR